MAENWQLSRGLERLPHDEVHVWQARITLAATAKDPLVQPFRAVLAPDERERADRFFFEKDRVCFTVARGLLRMLLANYLLCRPEAIRFSYTSYGKPFLAEPRSTLQFNISHSRDLALFSFTHERAVGVDIEYMRDVEFAALAAHSFSAHEQETLRSLPPELVRQGFYNCWSRKEAYIKARGLGLSLPLGSFDVSLRPGEPAQLLASREEPPQDITRWQMVALDVAPEYAAALAVEGQDWQLRCWCYEQ
ncbi:4'-phosphopantetheinyl transferase [Thermosporothrix hazakensis]|jgi:4'-phosphopantetheinyl transferase|uniref:4'-phosphopantetheinyl transferase n=2 Tax=Thermosporothrix TaxID=768650 RepID=A0A326U344_THEHA|nr:4'-phosphopantetheinyl transferase superfamily protein [Thermosporothrix hazakensis]PZW25450.1 4'-phosphopantetheinyl transferase [Thermosporothrix hazakensis]